MQSPAPDQLEQFRQAVITASNNPSFRHHRWFVEHHLEIVDRIAAELLEFYPEANPALVKTLVWLHDYGKALDFDNQYELTLSEGRKKFEELGFPAEFIDTVMRYMELIDKKMELDISEQPIEVQIVSTADGCSHYVGPFLRLWWYENANKPYKELMADNMYKLEKDWNNKIVLPEARASFEVRYKLIREECGDFPEKFL